MAAQASDRPSLTQPLALVAAVLWLALVSAVFITLLPGGLSRLRLEHHLFDLGHWLLLGVLLGAGSLVTERLASLAPKLGAAVPLAASFAVAWILARRDLAGFAEDRGGEQGSTPLLIGLTLLAATMPLAAAGVGRRLARGWLRLLGLLGATLVGVVNHLVLLADYRGLHLLAALAAAFCLAQVFAGLPIPAACQERRQRWALLAVLVVALPSLFVRPSNALRLELARIDGSPFVYVLAQFGWGKRTTQATVPPELAEWFRDRRQDPAISPTSPSLLPENALVVVIGIDSLRADLMTRTNTRVRLPTLRSLEAQSLTFTMARSPGARTITTWSSIFTGRHTSGLRWRGGGNRQSIRDDPTKRFPEMLVESGVPTVTFVSYGALGKKGLGRSFSEVVDVPARAGQKYSLSPEVAPLLRDRLVAEPGPLFAFAHFMDPHYPYDSVKAQGDPFARYLAEAELADQQLGQLIGALKESGRWDRTVLIVLSDHGEAFGQHGTPYHTVTVYEELIRVPLFIRIPGVKPRSIATPVSLIDLGPTVLDLYGLPTPASFLGQSLLPFARGETPTLTRPIGAERSGTRGLVLGPYKVIADRERGRDEIYDLRSDPQETVNLADSLGAEGDNMVELVNLFFDTHALGLD